MDELKAIKWKTLSSKFLRQLQFHMEDDGTLILRLEYTEPEKYLDFEEGEQLALEIQAEQIQYLSECLLTAQEFFAPHSNMKN
jgi:hypothetical protein